MQEVNYTTPTRRNVDLDGEHVTPSILHPSQNNPNHFDDDDDFAFSQPDHNEDVSRKSYTNSNFGSDRGLFSKFTHTRNNEAFERMQALSRHHLEENEDA